MALIKDYDLGGGITVVGAYHRLERLMLYSPKVYTGTQDSAVFSVEVATYKDEATREDGLTGPVVTRIFSLTVPANQNGNLKEQAYDALKLLPDFEGAQDA